MTDETPPLPRTKVEYLALPGVRAFALWLKDYWTGKVRFRHGYLIRSKPSRPWEASTLKEAAQQYEWPLKGPKEDRTLTKNEGRLEEFASRLQAGVKAADPKQLSEVCEAILRWGGVWKGNRHWLKETGERLPEHLERGMDWLGNPVGDPRKGFRFNSGLTKIYALLLPGELVIYDGRVGAALGALAVRFAGERNRGEIPEGLRFPWAQGRSRARRKPRGPFPRLGEPMTWALWALRASWLLDEVKKALPDAPPLRHLEAGLFMLGYALGDPPGLEGLAVGDSAAPGGTAAGGSGGHIRLPRR